MSEDPFGTERLREATLAAWTANPARFREDANAEEDHAHGYYRDRVVVELAQNAADAATRAGAPGRLLLRLIVHEGRDGTAVGSLIAANTGAPLDAAGVASLASLRASAKRSDHDGPGGTVGRFGVGFAAVRSVADRITVASTSGTVHFSLSRTAEAIAASGSADVVAEADRRLDRLPVLRLPWPGPATDRVGASQADGGTDPPAPPAVAALEAGWDTVVHLELRDAVALDAVRRQLDAVTDTLLLALPGLTAVEIDTPERARSVRDVGSRWVVATRTGTLPERLLRDCPVEERDRDGWQITWAVPRTGHDDGDIRADVPSGVGRVVHAPTPTDEPCTVPAVLIGTFPLDPTRRHVAAGPLTDALVGLTGEVWADLLAACRSERGGAAHGGTAQGGTAQGGTGQGGSEQGDGPSAPDPLDLLPTGLPAGTLDAAVRDAVVAATRTVPLFTPAGGGPALTAGEATALDGPGADHPGAAAVLGAVLPSLVEVARRHRDVLGLLGVERVHVADVVEAFPGDDAERRRALYEVFADADATTLEELATLPVRLADGRVVRGARGLLVADDVPEAVADVLGRWGVRLVAPHDAHPVLLRLGAGSADAAVLARHPVLRHHVLEGEDDDDPADVLLALVASSTPTPSLRAPSWWGEALLPAEDGEPVPARGLVMPGSAAARWFDPRVLPPVAPQVAQRWGEALVRIGVRTGLAVEHLAPDDVDDTDAPDEAPGEPPDASGPASASAPTDLADALIDGTLADHPLAGSLDGWHDYLDLVAGAGARYAGPSRATSEGSTTLAAVADLDAVRPDAWPEVLRALTTGEARRALVEPVHLGGAHAPSYTAWWLRRRSGLGLGRPFAIPVAADGAAEPGDGGDTRRRLSALSRLLGPVPDVLAGLDPEVLRALGGIADLTDLDADGWAGLLDALPPVGRDVDLAVAVAVWRGLARLAADTAADGAPDAVTPDAGRLPALTPDVVVVPSDSVAVADPMWAQHPDVRPVMVVPAGVAADVADLLDLDLAAERAAGRVTSRGVPAPVPDAVLAVFPEAPTRWLEHDDLTVDGRRVDWWVDPSPHAATTAGLAAALAYVVGWRHRDRIERLLVDDATDEVLLGLAGEEEP